VNSFLYLVGVQAPVQPNNEKLGGHGSWFHLDGIAGLLHFDSKEVMSLGPVLNRLDLET
jgi:hypothetical protein